MKRVKPLKFDTNNWYTRPGRSCVVGVMAHRVRLYNNPTLWSGTWADVNRYSPGLLEKVAKKYGISLKRLRMIEKFNQNCQWYKLHNELRKLRLVEKFRRYAIREN